MLGMVKADFSTFQFTDFNQILIQVQKFSAHNVNLLRLQNTFFPLKMSSIVPEIGFPIFKKWSYSKFRCLFYVSAHSNFLRLGIQ